MISQEDKMRCNLKLQVIIQRLKPEFYLDSYKTTDFNSKKLVKMIDIRLT